MAKKNFTITTVATAPSPATSGTSLVVAAGTGSLFALNEPAIIFPVNDQPLVANAEIVMVTNVSTDTLTITRTQESTSARTIVEGDIIIQGITAKDWNDLVTLVSGKITAFADPNADRIVFWDDSAGAFAALTASTGLTISGTNMTVRTSSATQTGIVELATTAETETGTDATRAVTPDGLHDMTTLAGASWFLDEDNMASNSAVKTASQQSIKAYVDSGTVTMTNKTIDGDDNTVQDLPYSAIKSTSRSGLDEKIITGTPNTTNLGLVQWNSDGDAVDSLVKPAAVSAGWISFPVGTTCTYVGADDPTYTMYVSGEAQTFLSVGMKFECFQSGMKFFFITAIGAYDSGNDRTLVTLYGGTDYDLANAEIGLPAYSMVKSPYGFPMSPTKWRQVYSSTSDVSQSNSAAWAQFTGAELSIPIGVWNVYYVCNSFDSHASQPQETRRTLSTTTNSVTNAALTDTVYFGLLRNDVQFSKSAILELTSKATYYLLGITNNATATLINRGSAVSPTLIVATCAYL